MQLSKNRVIMACAGSGKTTRLVDEALANRNRRIAIITYTHNNAREIITRFGNKNSGIPPHVDVMTWYEFLLRECARPYQRSKYSERRIESLLFVTRRSARGVKESDTRRHYFANDTLIYSDKISKFVVECEAKTSNAVTSRLGKVYTDVFVDEFQDLAGWDLEVMRMLMQSGIRITLVGDPRQHIYSTNPAAKNKQYLGIKVVDLVEKWRKEELCLTSYMSSTHRCNASICAFSNAFWPTMNAMTSLRNGTTGHDGVFLVAANLVDEYVARFQPQVLRYNRLAKAYGNQALNFGQAKGLQFERVLIVPTGPIKKYLRCGDLNAIAKSKDKLHVAVTRAWNSVAFVFDADSVMVPNRWEP